MNLPWPFHYLPTVHCVLKMQVLFRLSRTKSRLSTLSQGNLASFSSVIIEKKNSSSNLKGYKKYTFQRDYVFNYFRDKEVYKNSAVQRWTFSDLLINISKFLPRCEKESDRLVEMLQFVSLEQNVNRLTPAETKHCLAILANMCFNNCKPLEPFNLLDKKCSSCIHSWSLESTLYVFDALYVLKNQKAFQGKYFACVLDVWGRNISHCHKHHIVQILYYLGQFKSMPEDTMKIFSQQIMKHLPSFSAEEWAIICLSFFKKKMKLEEESVLLKTVESAKLLMTQNNRFHCISAIKCLRLAQYYDKSLLQMLSEYVLKEFSTFNFVECTNFLAAFTSENVYDMPVFVCLEKHASEILKNELCCEKERIFSIREHPSIHCRAKDVARFLWAIAYVGHEPKRDTLSTVMRVLNSKLAHNEFREQPFTLVDSLQSLSMLGIYPENLLNTVFQTKFLEQIWELKRVKPRYQLYFLLQATSIEYSDWFKKLNVDTYFLHQFKPLPKDLDQQIHKRNILKRFTTFLKCSKLEEAQVECCYVLPHLPVAGIFVKHSLDSITQEHHGFQTSANSPKKFSGKGFCIEVLDEHTCARDSGTPLGFMKTKIRHLKLSYPVFVFTSQEIEELLNLPPSEQTLWLSSTLGL